MSFSIRSVAAGLVLVTASLLSGCGGGSGKPAPGMGCALNSECATGLICTFGFCHSQCEKDNDCTPGMCVKSTALGDGGGAINVCQLATETQCYYNSDCKDPLVCGRDEKCRNQCQSAVDCVTGQVCTSSGVCADKSQIVAGTNDVTLVTTGRDGGADAYASGEAGTGVTATGGAGGSTTGTGGTIVTGTGGTAGGGGTTGLAGSTGKGGAGGMGGKAGTGGTAGSSGGCSSACGVGKQCVAGTCQTCGVAGATCCGTGATATCNSNLTCVGGTCTCGDATQACCDGTTCNTGFQCVGGTCSCGGAGQYCCAGAPKCSGSLLCGGRRCGCATACDQNAALKNDGSIFISGTPITNTNGTLFLATSMSYNGYFGCAIKADTTVWCWGTNSYGALGIGDTTISSSKAPVQVSTAMASGSPLTGITSVVVADLGYSACAIGAGGALWCWGYGASGQLGIGDQSNSSFAVPVVGDASATQVTGFATISPSYYNTCGMKTDNSVWCWGDNYYGEIGNGTDGQTTTSKRYQLYPTQVTNLATSATSVMTSYWNYTSCASTNDGSAYCWGYNGYGDLANGLNTGYANVPSQVLTAAATPLTNVAKVLNWYGKPCAVRTDGSVWCWPDAGANYYAVQLKDSSSNRVTGLTTVGRDCYLDTDDQVWYNGSTSTSYQVTCP